MHSANLRGMFGPLERLGYDVDSLLAPFGLTRAELEDPDGRLPGRVCAEIFAEIAFRRSLLDYLVCSSESVADAFKQLARYLGLVNPAIHLVFREEEDPIRVLVEGFIDPFTVELTVSLSVLRLSRESGHQHAGGAHLLPPRAGRRQRLREIARLSSRDSILLVWTCSES